MTRSLSRPGRGRRPARLLELAVITPSAAPRLVSRGSRWRRWRPALLTRWPACACPTIDCRVVAVAVASATLAARRPQFPRHCTSGAHRGAGLAAPRRRALGDRGDRRRRDGLLIAQVGLAVVLLVVRRPARPNVRARCWSARPASDRRCDRRRADVLAHQVSYPPSARSTHGCCSSAARLPGVTTAAATIQTRFVLNETVQTLFEIEGRPTASGEQRFVNIRHVTPDSRRCSASVSAKRCSRKETARTRRRWRW